MCIVIAGITVIECRNEELIRMNKREDDYAEF